MHRSSLVSGHLSREIPALFSDIPVVDHLPTLHTAGGQNWGQGRPRTIGAMQATPMAFNSPRFVVHIPAHLACRPE